MKFHVDGEANWRRNSWFDISKPHFTVKFSNDVPKIKCQEYRDKTIYMSSQKLQSLILFVDEEVMQLLLQTVAFPPYLIKLYKTC